MKPRNTRTVRKTKNEKTFSCSVYFTVAQEWGMV